ncbi:hypothetical protein BD560DRAFT_321711 [Blakeslea trispora]|nr:hypothetical protein BD560DRAFT_321711 [Blakeslea trispora]
MKGSKIKKTYPCSQCSKSFTRPSQLQTHTYSHTDEKPFQCNSIGCNRKFSVASNLRRHLKVHQKPVSANTLSSEDRVKCVRRLMRQTSLLLSRRPDWDGQKEMRYTSEGHTGRPGKHQTTLPSSPFLPLQQKDIPTTAAAYYNSYTLPDLDTTSTTNIPSELPYPLPYTPQTTYNCGTNLFPSNSYTRDTLYGTAGERQRDTLKLPGIIPRRMDYQTKD